ncbi:hypothetical protein AWB64_02472 [Caballeronia sordidicola]|uniref:Uncharacterized protein n=1 Tax=Caballeronia sordidicola TaxID=196367 RepID=A0A158GB01_CABSO|nr:hypothetical protein AWB64_02472 [Caballeronia sordidicola]
MNDTVETRRTKERSPNFPFIPLESALQRAQVLYSHERRSSAPSSSVAKHWGNSELSSGFKQTVAALKSYGLLSDEPGSGARMVRLTDLALRILLDSRPESEEKAAYTRQAALTPPVASEVFQRWPDGLPSDHTLSHYLMFDRGFQQETAARVARTLRQNESFAGLRQYLSVPESEMPAGDDLDAPEPPVHEFDVSRATAVPSQLNSVATSVSARSEKIIDPNGLDVTVAFSGEPTQETYEFLADYIELRLKQFQRKAARTMAAGSAEPAP